MDRALRLTGFWNWLPAFRAVAETEHLPTAAARLHVSPSALSRTVRQLEDALGQPLFVRARRRLQLTPAGRALLEAVRRAMRGLDDELAQLGPLDREPVRVRVAAASPWWSLLVLPALAGELVVHVELAADRVVPALLQGEVDLVLGGAPAPDDRIVVERLLGPRRVLACGSGQRRRADALPFAVCTTEPDGWPPDRPRSIGLASPRLDVVLEACARGGYRAVVPAVLARARGLVTLPSPALGGEALFVTRRRPLGPGLLDGLAGRLRRVGATLDPRP